MEMANGFAAVVTRAISESPVACTPLGGLHDCEWADSVVRFVVTLVQRATFPVTAFNRDFSHPGGFVMLGPLGLLRLDWPILRS